MHEKKKSLDSASHFFSLNIKKYTIIEYKITEKINTESY